MRAQLSLTMEQKRRPKLHLAELLDRGEHSPAADLVAYLRRYDPPRPTEEMPDILDGEARASRRRFAAAIAGLGGVLLAGAAFLLWDRFYALGAVAFLLALLLGIALWSVCVRMPASRKALVRDGVLRLGTVTWAKPALPGKREFDTLGVAFRADDGSYWEVAVHGPPGSLSHLPRGAHLVVLATEEPWPVGVFTRRWDLLVGRVMRRLGKPEPPSRE